MKNKMNIEDFVKKFIFLIFSCTLLSCAITTEVKIHSKVDESFPGELDRLFVIFYLVDDEETRFSKYFRESFLAEAEHFGLTAQVILREAVRVESDRLEYKKALKAFSPRMVLRIKRVGWRTEDGEISQAKFRMGLFKFSNHKIRKRVYWSAQVKLEASNFSLSKEDYGALARELMGRLEQAGII